MCPCPFCATSALIVAILLPFKKTRNWLTNKMKSHHGHCDVCQKAEHEHCVQAHIPCHCKACRAQHKVRATAWKKQRKLMRARLANKQKRKGKTK